MREDRSTGGAEQHDEQAQRLWAEARSITNFIGNGVACIVVSRWEKELDVEALRRELAKGPEPV